MKRREYRKSDNRFSEKTPGGIRDKCLNIRLTEAELEKIRLQQQKVGVSVAKLLLDGLEAQDLLKNIHDILKEELGEWFPVGRTYTPGRLEGLVKIRDLLEPE